MQSPVNDDFREFLKLLIENEIQYLIVGGYAVSLHSRPRYTDDLDVWINNTPESFRKIKKVLKLFGFSAISINEKEFFSTKKVYRIGKPPIRIEILNQIDGVDFKEAFKNKTIGKYFDLKNVYYISFEDLLKNKKNAGRTKDKMDLDYLKTYKKK